MTRRSDAHASPVRGTMVAMRLAAAPAFVLLAAVAAAQEQAPREPRTAIERHLLALADPAQRSAAMFALWREGPPAVPMLAAAVARGGDGAAPALRVLLQLGGEAAPAAPVLHRAMDKAAEPWRSELAAAIARIEGPPCILLSLNEKDEVAQVDFDGKIVRRAACKGPWGVWPMPGDRFGAISFDQGAVVLCDWDGTVKQNDKVVHSMTSFQPLDDGSRVTTNWEGDGVLARRGADNAVIWSKKNDSFRSLRLFDQVLAVTRKPPSLTTLSLDGEVLNSVVLPTPCCGVFPLPNGHTMVSAHSGQVFEVDADGKAREVFKVQGIANDVVRLRDGRTVVSGASGLLLFAADGKVLWHLKDLGKCGPMFVRVPW